MNIAVIGGGVIGLGVGWQLLRRGVGVTLFERDRAGAATGEVAAGMLAPYAEVGFEELELMKLGQESLSLYPQFLEELKEDTDGVPELDTCGTLLVGVDRDDAQQVRRLYDFRRELDMRIEKISSAEARDREPLLSPRVVSAVWLPDDAQIDNRGLMAALVRAFQARGGDLREQSAVDNIIISGNRVEGVDISGEHLKYDAVVIAAGCWSDQIGGLTGKTQPMIRPLKGQILTLKQSSECEPSCMIRSPRVYLVPKSDGKLRLGATSEEKGFDTRPTAGAVKELLEDGWELVPSIYDLPLLEIQVGLRPSARDHAPSVGHAGVDGLFFATGHYRHGILYTPVTAYSLAGEILDGKPIERMSGFSPRRFFR